MYSQTLPCQLSNYIAETTSVPLSYLSSSIPPHPNMNPQMMTATSSYIPSSAPVFNDYGPPPPWTDSIPCSSKQKCCFYK